MQLIECVPNFSEGNDWNVIRQITDQIESVAGICLLNIDIGKAANRTVVTFAGSPKAVVQAAFKAIKTAGELIDMSKQKGEHPRIGATDVCPLVPLENISLQETATYAQQLAALVGKELRIPVYLYEAAQPKVERKNLSVIRAGQYEGFFKKIKQPAWTPDFGPDEFDAHRGATVIGARNFLVAYNVNLNTASVSCANAIARSVRTSGHFRTNNGIPVLDAAGNKMRTSGSLKFVKAIGWYIKEYGKAQVSMNLTNINQMPLHTAFDEVCTKAAAHGVRVTGSELVGLIPLQCMVQAGSYFLQKQKRSVSGVSEKELVAVAIASLGLDELAPFIPEERIIEYVLAAKAS